MVNTRAAQYFLRDVKIALLPYFNIKKYLLYII